MKVDMPLNKVAEPIELLKKLETQCAKYLELQNEHEK